MAGMYAIKFANRRNTLAVVAAKAVGILDHNHVLSRSGNRPREGIKARDYTRLCCEASKNFSLSKPQSFIFNLSVPFTNSIRDHRATNSSTINCE